MGLRTRAWPYCQGEERGDLAMEFFVSHGINDHHSVELNKVFSFESLEKLF